MELLHAIQISISLNKDFDRSFPHGFGSKNIQTKNIKNSLCCCPTNVRIYKNPRIGATTALLREAVGNRVLGGLGQEGQQPLSPQTVNNFDCLP